MSQRLAKLLPHSFLAVWGMLLSVVVASLMIGHWVSLPHPQAGQRLPSATQVSRAGEQDVQCAAFHFLYGDCPCSRRVLKKVIARQPVPGACETIVFIGEDAEFEAKAAECGFRVETLAREELKAKYGIESAPLLVVTDGQGIIQYSGGYTSRKQGLDIQDEELIRAVLAGNPREGLPLYGCAVSKELKSIVDPLDLK